MVKESLLIVLGGARTDDMGWRRPWIGHQAESHFGLNVSTLTMTLGMLTRRWWSSLIMPMLLGKLFHFQKNKKSCNCKHNLTGDTFDSSRATPLTSTRYKTLAELLPASKSNLLEMSIGDLPWDTGDHLNPWEKGKSFTFLYCISQFFSLLCQHSIKIVIRRNHPHDLSWGKGDDLHHHVKGCSYHQVTCGGAERRPRLFVGKTALYKPELARNCPFSASLCQKSCHK